MKDVEIVLKKSGDNGFIGGCGRVEVWIDGEPADGLVEVKLEIDGDGPARFNGFYLKNLTVRTETLK